MSLFLLESALSGAAEPTIDRIAAAIREASGDFVEARVTAERDRLFVVVEHDGLQAVTAAVGDLDVDDIAEVRLVGADLAEVKAAAKTGPRYLVEWDLPEGLDMDTYLARKRSKSPLYEQIPEVAFRRTYVREDMDKCLCFYDGACEDDVLRARKIVDAPVDRFHELA
jgi:hypothetical protein